jgi:hypothetical protein
VYNSALGVYAYDNSESSGREQFGYPLVKRFLVWDMMALLVLPILPVVHNSVWD